MGSRDRDTKSLQDKLKVLFKKGGSAPLAAQNELVVTPEHRRELSPEVPLNRRLRAIKELSDKVLHIRVQEGGIEKIWQSTRDLLDDPSMEARHAVLGLLRCIAEGQTDLLIMRTILFRYLQETPPSKHPEDFHLRFKLLHTLTNTGKDIKCFEEQMGPFLLEWLPQMPGPAQIIDFVQLITNVVKFNAVYLDEEIVHGIVNNACHLCVQSTEAGVVQGGLSLLEAVLSYSLLPRAALHTFVAALCRTVNLEPYCQNSWKLMRYVVGADMGHAALQEMVAMLCAAGAGAGAGGGAGEEEVDAGLARGAVFYISMALWGPRRVLTLHVSHLAVLPAFLKALRARQPVVAYEVVVALQSLVTRAPLELHEVAWDALLALVRAVLDLDKSFDPPNELIHKQVHALITCIEQLQEAGQYQGDPDALLDLVDYCGHDRPEASVNRLISARGAALGSGDTSAALALLERYVRLEPRLPVRLHALRTLRAYIQRHGGAGGAGEEAVERVGGALAAACAGDAECALRAAAARALPALARLASPDACIDLVDQLERILNRPFEMYVSEVPIPAEADTSDLAAAAGGLLELLHDRLLRAPAAPAARALLVLLDHLDHHYRRPALFLHHPEIRLKIFDMLFGLRANEFNCVGFCYEGGVAVWGPAALRLRPTCSPFLLAEPLQPRGQPAPPPRDLPPGSCMIPAARMARVVCAALGGEREWAVLGALLRALAHLLPARALLLGRRAPELDLLAGTLCALLAERAAALAERLRAPPLLSDFQAAVLPPLAAMASYNAFLEPTTQHRVLRCLLKHGMVMRSPAPYISALTLFALETRETMVRMLPEVLLDLSKISDTQAIASPMLEFLSTLTRLPRVFASFVEDQYMSVFAILLPYTNPSRYNHYAVSLAHHVIAAWFLKCRLSYRRNFVRFIIHGLHNYIIMPIEEQLQYKSNNFHQNSVNEDSSNRQRSSSLGSKAVSRAPLAGRGGSRVGAGAGAAAGAGGAGGGASAPAAFHVELTETCVDLLARYTFTPCSVKPQRNDSTEFLFKGGQSSTWLVGHKLVTITTSGCLQNSNRQGMCDRCATLCRAAAESVEAVGAGPGAAPGPVGAGGGAASPHEPQPEPPPQVQIRDSSESNSSSSNNHLQVNSHSNNHPEVKRYSKWSLQHSRSTETSCSSLSISELLPPSSGHVSRQNSSENKSDALADVLNQFTQRLEKISKEVERSESAWWRAGALAGAGAGAGGACACWCARWARLHVRSPTGDVSWLLRMQNHISSAQLQEWPLQDVLAMLSPPLGAPADLLSAALDHAHPHTQPHPHAASATDLASEESVRTSRPQHAADLHKSSSDTVVASERRAPSASAPAPAGPAALAAPGQQPPRSSTQPINIPGSPQRAAPPDDDMLLVVPEGKSRHPVRRSNSSPEMSSSWKAALRDGPAPPAPLAAAAPPADPPEDLPPPLDMILLPVCEPTSTSMTMHASKKAAKKSDMRVSCEAIPEETGTSPQPHHPHLPQHQHPQHAQHHQHAPQPVASHAAQQKPHPHLMTYNSDPGAGGSDPEPDEPHEPHAEGPPAHHQHHQHHAHHAHHQLQKTSSDSTVAAGGDELPPLARSKRSNTISVMSPTERARYHTAREGARAGSSSGGSGGASAGGGGGGGGVAPSFVFLQLYHNMSTYPISPSVPGEAAAPAGWGSARPLRVAGAQHERTLKNIDLMPPLETYKVGVLYVGPGQQDDEVAILKNEYGSVRYSEFLRALGTLVPLEGADDNLFLNLEGGGKDGRYTYVWTDDIMQVQFHVATAMPSCARDPHCNEKRKYIGNDFVSIVYNDSGRDFNILTIKGQFNLCVVVVEPAEGGLSRVLVKTKDERIRGEYLAHLRPAALSNASVPLLARQLALHCALASQISQSLERAGGQPYASNCLERLRLVKRLRARIEAERRAAAARAPPPYTASPHCAAAQRRVAIDDFNDYT